MSSSFPQVSTSSSTLYGDYSFAILQVLLGITLNNHSLWLTKDAEGSGIPELRSIMGGNPIYRFISMRTYVGRSIGLICSITAGLSVGKEGPFINLAACIANALARLDFFQSIQKVN